MKIFQKHLFNSVLGALFTFVLGLIILAVLAQGLSKSDLVVSDRQSASVFLYIIALGTPQIIALLLPLAMFVATIWTLNKCKQDNEIAVIRSAGLTRWKTASPVLRLACWTTLLHLTINLWVQPAAQQEMRHTISDARANIAAALVRPGQFTQYADNQLIFYARESSSGELKGIYISDSRNPENIVNYLAQTGAIVTVDGIEAIVMNQGQIQQLDPNDVLSILDFEQYTFDLSPFLHEESDIQLKSSDRYVHNLFFIDDNNPLDVQDANIFLAEGHTRLATPIWNIALALIAILAVLGGETSRMGYSRRITIASIVAVTAFMAKLGIQSASINHPTLNSVQWGLPLFLVVTCLVIYLAKGFHFKKIPDRRVLMATPKMEAPAP